MKFVDSWHWPDGEAHMISWMSEPKNRLVINDRPSYQGKKQLAALGFCHADRRRTMIDAGAHIGLWSYNFAHWFDRIEAFEPVVDHAACWRENLNGPVTGPKVVMHPFALGEAEGMVHIRVNPTSTGDSWVKGKGETRMVTIDQFDFENVDLIKIDAEGYEEFIVRGAMGTIQRWKPVIVVEQKRDMAVKFGLSPMGAVKTLIGHGYKVAQEIAGDYIMVPA
jgi:FkbM family methyltransferase